MEYFESKLYKSVDITPHVLSQQIDDYQDGDVYGYFLIEDKLVPKSLVMKIYEYLCGITFDYGEIWSIQDLLEGELWLSLNDFERSVAGDCILIIIENGYSIPVPVMLEHKH